MANYNSLKTTINANVKRNGNQEITGQILNSVLNAMVDTLGTGYSFAGVATPATNPGTPDAKVFYIANGKGTYTHFGELEVTEDDVVVLYWDSLWHKESTGIAREENLTNLEKEVATKQNALTDTDGGYGQRVAELEKEGIASQEKLTELDEKINGKIIPPLSVDFSYAQGTIISENNKFPFFIKGGESQTLLISGESSHFSSGSIYIYFYDENDVEILHFSKPIGVEWNWAPPRNVSKIAFYKAASQVLGSGVLSVSLPYSGYNVPGLSEEVEEIKSDILVSIKGKVDNNEQDLSNIKKDLYGIVIDKEIEAASSTNGKYVNATNSGAITGGSSSSAIAFYPIEKDKTYHIEIPKVGNSATYVFSFADTIMDTGYVPHHLDMIGNSQPLSIDIVAPNYAYLIIDYAYASGMPVVTTKVVNERIFAKLTEIPQIPESKKSLKILYFGNSFTQDSVGYMPFILKGLDENIELTVGIAYTGGANLKIHCANILNQAIGNVSPSNYTYYNKYRNGAEKWISSSNVSAATILADEEWDVVTFQQSSNLAASEFNTYIAPYIYKIEHYLSSYFHTKPIKTGWLLTQSIGNDFESRLSNYNGVAVTARKVMELTSSAFLIPYGTAVQNLRSISSLDVLGVGGGMSYDGQHLQEGIGCLVAAYTHTLVCLQLLGIQNRSILGENTRPNESWIIDKAIPLPNWDDSHTVIGITDSNCYLAQMAANLAIKKMFEVTDMSGIDLFL